MPTLRSQLAKLSRPRLRGVTARDRLFRALDQARDRPLVWVVGPPGAGKTTLVANYFDIRGYPGLWYQMETADSDPATFFYYLRQAARAIGTKASRPLPLLTPEYLPDLAGFGRRFFRDLFARLGGQGVLAFDNFHEVAPESALHSAIECAAEQIPPGSNLLILSREAPPAQFSRCVANGLVATIGWAQLRLSSDETQAIVSRRGAFTRETIEALHAQAGGWPAGVTLLLERLRDSGMVGEIDRSEAMETVFGYFAGQIFDRATPELRELLLKTAVFPWVTVEMAAAATGNRSAGSLLESLYRRGLFIERRIGNETTYQYHALFVAFLRHRATSQLPQRQLHALTRLAARWLGTRGYAGDAFTLLCGANDWGRAALLLIAAAPALIAHGRLQTVQEWAGKLPPAVTAARPWVRYWVAASLAPIDPAAARHMFERAFHAFREHEDDSGQMQSAAGILDTIYMEYSDFTPMDPWIETLARFLGKAPAPASADVRLRVYSALLVATSLRQPSHPLVKVCAREVVRLIGDSPDVNLKVWAAIRLSTYLHMTADFELAFAAIAQVEPLLDRPELAPPHAAEYSHVLGYSLYLHGDYDQALSRYQRAIRIAEAEGLLRLKVWILPMRAACERRAGDVAAAERTLGEMESLPKPQHGAVAGLFQVVKALTAYSRGNLALAIDEGLASQRIMDAAGAVALRALNCVHNVGMLIGAGDLDRAFRLCEEARALVTGSSMAALLGTIALHQAHIAHLREETQGRAEYLTEALRFLRRDSGKARARWYPETMSPLFAVALREGIEPAFVKALIREFRLAPGTAEEAGWPWPIEIFTLGRFALVKDGLALTFEHKAPRRPIAVLKVLVARGATDVPISQVIDDLWPGAEGDAAQEACRTALHRLRRLLGNPDAIALEDGRLSLDLRQVWIDTLAFEQAADTSADPARIASLYRGQFLPEEREAPWALPMRERLRNRFVRHVAREGLKLEEDGQFAAAVGLYERGIDADDLAEEFYQGLMRCHIGRGHPADAMAVYRRLRRMLSVTLGIPPSRASNALFRRLEEGGEGQLGRALDAGLPNRYGIGHER